MNNYIKIFTPTLLAVVISIAACNQQQENKANVAMEELENHIDSLETQIQEMDGKSWAKEHWKELEAEYNELKLKVENELSDDDTNSMDQLEEKWESISTEIESYSPYSTLVVDVYSALGTSPEEFSMNFVTRENILSKYEAFIETVENNKKAYSSNDWADLEVLWEALNDRKNELEPLETEKNLKIAELKVEYGTIKAVRKTEAKAEEKVNQLEE
jgi:hypothetical protein